MQIFEELLREISEAIRDNITLVIDGGLITNYSYSENVVPEYFLQAQKNIITDILSKVRYTTLYFPRIFTPKSDGVRHENETTLNTIDTSLKRNIEVFSPHQYDMVTSGKNQRIIEAEINIMRTQ